MAAILMIASVLIHQFEGIFIKKYNSKHTKGGFIFTALVSMFSMLFFLITDKNGFYVPLEMIPYAVVSGILYCSASFLTYVALGCGSYVLSNLILSYGLIFSIGYGLFFLDEPASIYTYIGLAILFISIYLVRASKEENSNPFSKKWLICILLSAVGSGMFGVVSRMQQIEFDNACTNEFMTISLALSTVALLIVGIVKDKKDLGYILKYGSVYAISAGLSNGATNLLALIVNTMIPLSVASPTKAGIKIVLSFAISKMIFKEKFIKRQIVGVILGAIALVLLNLKL